MIGGRLSIWIIKKGKPYPWYACVNRYCDWLFAYWQQDLPGTTEKIDYAKLVQTIKDDKVKEISLQRKDRELQC